MLTPLDIRYLLSKKQMNQSQNLKVFKWNVVNFIKTILIKQKKHYI